MAEIAVLSEQDVKAETLKDEGNTAYQQAEYRVAVSKYSAAIDLANVSQHILYGNRSMAYLKLGEHEEALKDAEKAIELDPSWVKGHFRKISCLVATESWDAVASACKKALKLDPKNRPILKVYKQAREKLPKEAAVLKSKKVPISPSVTSAETTESTRLFNRIKRMANEDHVAGGMIEKTFIALMDPAEFKRRIYPGLDLPEGSPAPKTLKELLNDPIYQHPLQNIMPTVIAKANRIIDNVKRKGAAQGEVMDQQTEDVLRPQVLMEAFAREITGVVNRTAAMVSKQFALLGARIADPNDDRAQWDLLPEPTMKAWDTEGQGFAVADAFMGDGFSSLVLDDLKRLRASDRLQPTVVEDVHARSSTKGRVSGQPLCTLIAWLEPGESLEEQYPALSELFSSLHALPFELNAKSASNRYLTDPSEEAVLVTFVPTGASMKPRWDGQSGNIQSGVVVSATYCPQTHPAAQIDLTLPTARQVSIELKGDRLLLHDSLTVKHGMNALPAADGDGVFLVSAFYRSKAPAKV